MPAFFVTSSLSRLPGLDEPCPVVLLLREAESRLLLKGVPEVLDTLYQLSSDRLVLFPFAGSFLDTIDQLMDPIVAKRGCERRGIYYLTDVSPSALLEALLQIREDYPVVSDQAVSGLPQGEYHAKREDRLEGTHCHWYRISRGSHILPKTVRDVLPVQESREIPARREGVLSWLG